jgi:hypothetical protein
MRRIQLAFLLHISYRIFLCSLTVSDTSLFLTWSVQLIFSILLQHHISKLSRCFCSVPSIYHPPNAFRGTVHVTYINCYMFRCLCAIFR